MSATAQPRPRSGPKPASRFPWRGWLGVLALVLLLGPAAVMLIYRFVPPPASMVMLERRAHGVPMDQRWVPLSAMSPWLPRAAIASEDNRFCQHWGIDTGALKEQIDKAMAGGSPRGASTITQQTAKNLFLWDGRDPVRKVLEAWLAPQLELLLGKRRILEIYLNIAEFGRGVYGVEAASERYFHRHAKDLTEQEASLLIAVLPAPLRWSPVRPSPLVAFRARVARLRIGQLGPLLDCAP
jgi:monofunctional biosynthetic peptidoglycan transglycosylase